MKALIRPHLKVVAIVILKAQKNYLKKNKFQHYLII